MICPLYHPKSPLYHHPKSPHYHHPKFPFYHHPKSQHAHGGRALARAGLKPRRTPVLEAAP
jgi:hypothetical protein